MRLPLELSAKHCLLLLALLSLLSGSSAAQSPDLHSPHDQQGAVVPSRTTPDDFDRYFEGRSEFINAVYTLGPNAIVYTELGYYFWDHTTRSLTPRDYLHQSLYAKDSRLWFFKDKTVYTIDDDGQARVECNVNTPVSGIYRYADRLIVVAEDGVYIQVGGATALALRPRDSNQLRKAASPDVSAQLLNSGTIY
jgi:hypothetical protein